MEAIIEAVFNNNNSLSEVLQNSWFNESEKMILINSEDDFDGSVFENGTSSSNGTVAQSFEVTLSQQITMTVIGIFIVSINLLVVTTSGLIMKKGIEPRCTYLLLGNLALVDMVIGMVGIIVVLFFKELSRLQFTGCVIKLGIFNSTMIVSIYTVMLIALDRFLYIIHGIKYNQLVYPRRVRLMIVLTWIFGISVGMLPGFGWSANWQEGQLCLYIDIVPKTMILIILIITTIPIPIMLGLYITILVKAFKKIGQTESGLTLGVVKDTDPKTLRTFRGGSSINLSATISENSSSGYSTGASSDTVSKIISSKDLKGKIEKTNSANMKKLRAIKVVMLTTGGYIVTWIPICITTLLITYCDPTLTPERCYSIKSASAYLSTLSFLNCFLNPIIYAWWHNGFRKSAIRIYHKKRKELIEWCARLKFMGRQ